MIGLSSGPPLGGKTPSGSDAWSEIASVGVDMLRYYPTWPSKQPDLDNAIAQMKENLAAAAAHSLRLWIGLHPAGDKLDEESTQVLNAIVGSLKDEPGVGAWKGADEPEHGGIPATDLVPVYEYVKELDPDHPLVLIQAPVCRGGVSLTAEAIAAYTPALDITGVDIFPVSYPPGKHAARSNTEISVVGDVVSIIAQAAPGKPVWAAIQITWSGVMPPKNVPRFPSLREERFMAYQAIIAGARGLNFFGGELLETMSPADAKAGWNWTFWYEVARPLICELSSPAVGPALDAPAARSEVTADSDDIQLTAREANGFFYVIAVRTSSELTTEVTFSGLPAATSSGEALFEYLASGVPAGRGGERSVQRLVRTVRRPRLPLPGRIADPVTAANAGSLRGTPEGLYPRTPRASPSR